MLHAPHRIEAQFVGQRDLFEAIVEHALFALTVPWTRHRNLIEDSKLHRVTSRITASKNALLTVRGAHAAESLSSAPPSVSAIRWEGEVSKRLSKRGFDRAWQGSRPMTAASPHSGRIPSAPY